MPISAALCILLLHPNTKALTPVLNYHDVIPKRDKNSLWFDCTIDEFKNQLDWLQSRGAHFVSLDDLYSHLTKGANLPPKAVAITFADNYLGFYRYAVPELKKRKIPCTMFVHTGYVGSNVGRPKLTWKMLRDVSADTLFTIGSQTVNHPDDVRKLNDHSLQKELIDSKSVLEKQLGKKVLYLAYPNGKFDQRCEGAAKRAGYLMAFTEAQKPAEMAHNNWSMPRYVHTKWRQAWFDSGRK